MDMALDPFGGEQQMAREPAAARRHIADTGIAAKLRAFAYWQGCGSGSDTGLTQAGLRPEIDKKLHCRGGLDVEHSRS
jgi:hypothetical protein